MRMSVNPLFGNKKRNSSMLYGHAPLATSSSVFHISSSKVGNHRDGFPPSKRYKSDDPTDATALDDPFDENEDFTVDDLEEIDILATQALTEEVQEIAPLKRTKQTEQVLKTRASTSSTGLKSRSSNSWDTPYNAGSVLKDTIGNRTENVKTSDSFGLQVLQAQHEELKQKLKEVQDEILVKNGEIKVLRESLRQSEHDQEHQRRTYSQLEKEKAQAQSEKDKEFTKKLQSLQSELQFKDAEMNEMRTRLQNCERLSRSAATSTPCISPKKGSPGSLKPESCSSLQFGKNSFPTKESFNAEMSSKTLMPLAQQVNQNLFNKEGSILLNALMKQSMAPGALGLYHLLSSSPEPLPEVMLQNNIFSSEPTGLSTITTTGSTDGPLASLSSLKEAQKLAITGLHLIAMDEGQTKNNLVHSQEVLFSLPKPCKLPGAVHILPLVEHHVTMYCRALQAMEKSGIGPSDKQSLTSTSTTKSIGSSTEEFLSSLEDCTVASLGVLYYLVFYSQEVVCTLLCSGKEGYMAGVAGTLKVDDNPATTYPCDNEPRTSLHQEGPSADQPQHPLFQKTLQLLGLSITTQGCQRAHIVNQCLNVLVKLAENSTTELLTSFQSFLTNPVLLRCLCPHAPLSAAHLTVRLLAVFAEHQPLAAQLCSSSETCVLLALYAYITLRPDKLASEKLWLLLEEEIIQFLTKLCVQCLGPYTTNSESTCQCNREAVKALVIMLHRQWLKVRRPENRHCGFQKKAVQFLRDTLLLLHSISQKDKTFNEHCMEVLHQYDQAVPGIRTIFRKLPDLKESEELALEDLCPPEPEMDDQDMDCD
ncbi:ATR-interacting protein isoform X2 [Pleurodeles waltl]|uniref:ATR-interacting protein isoform X2 n=1 Tax=Pleurodeles waltl TaxID=8319 RepID=UPI0037099C72